MQLVSFGARVWGQGTVSSLVLSLFSPVFWVHHRNDWKTDLVLLIFRSHHWGFQCSSLERHWVSPVRCWKPVFLEVACCFPEFPDSRIQLGGTLSTRTLLPTQPHCPCSPMIWRWVPKALRMTSLQKGGAHTGEKVYTKFLPAWGPFSQNFLHSIPTSVSTIGCKQLWAIWVQGLLFVYFFFLP